MGTTILPGIFNKIRFTLFSWFLLASCVVIFQIRCDLSDFLYPEFLIGDASKQLTFEPGGGGGGTPLQEANRDVQLDGVAF